MRYRPIIPRYGPVIQQSNHVCQLRESPFFQDTFARSGLLTLGDQLVWAQATTLKRPRYDEGRRRPRDVPRDAGRGWYGVGRCWDVGRYGDVSAKLTFVWNVCGCNQHKVGSIFGMRPWKEKDFGNRSLGWFGNIGNVTNRKWTSLWVSSTSIDVWPHHYLLDRQACSEFELLEDVATWVGSVSKLVTWHGNFKAQQSFIEISGLVLNKFEILWSIQFQYDLNDLPPWKPLKSHGQTPEIHGFSWVFVP